MTHYPIRSIRLTLLIIAIGGVLGGVIFHSWESVLGTLIGLLPVLIGSEVYSRKSEQL